MLNKMNKNRQNQNDLLKNKALLFFYIFSIISLILSLGYYMRFVRNFVQESDGKEQCHWMDNLVRQIQSLINPCIGHCYLRNW